MKLPLSNKKSSNKNQGFSTDNNLKVVKPYEEEMNENNSKFTNKKISKYEVNSNSFNYKKESEIDLCESETQDTDEVFLPNFAKNFDELIKGIKNSKNKTHKDLYSPLKITAEKNIKEKNK